MLNPLDKPNPMWFYKTERLISRDRAIIKEGIRHKSNLDKEKGLAALKLVELNREDPAHKLMSNLQNYAIYCPNTPVLRGLTPESQMRRPLGLSGGGIAEGFLSLQKRAAEDDILGDALDEILGMVDWVEDITTSTSVTTILSPSVPRPKRVIQFRDRFMKKVKNNLTAYDTSEGALYILFISILALSEESPPFFAVDNLEP